MATQFYIGKRLSYDGRLCTVRYQGEVKGTKGEWLGVEWDDPRRGKHSGEHGGIRYFECLNKGPTSGSFVRPARKPDPPRSFSEALKAKYASDPVQDPTVHIVFATQPGQNALKKDPLARINQPIRISGKEVEEVGFDKIRKQLAQLSELKIVILDGLCMERSIARSTEGSEGWPEGLTDVKEASPKAIELDLSRNLFEEWREVASICEQLEKLKTLRVDGNRFRDTTLTPAEHTRCLKAFAHITDLKLEETLLPWSSIAALTHLFPSLTAFSASSNLYTALTSHPLTPTLTSLVLEDNAITSLSSLQSLTNLPHLRRLVLKQNKIAAIASPNSPTPIFPPSLSELDLTFNDISTWPFIDALPASFPGLTSLRISHNPLYTSLTSPLGPPLTPEDGYMLTIARLSPLTSLNYSPIPAKERLNAESYYLSLIAKELACAPERERAELLKAHPRYDDLCAEYGAPVVAGGEGTLNPNSLAARLVRLNVRARFPSETPAEPDADADHTVTLEIPARCTAYTLLGLVSRTFAIAPTKLRLVWETGDWIAAPRAAVGESGSDSDSNAEVEDGDDDGEGTAEGEEREKARGRVMREVEIVPGTRSIGTWIEGMEGTIRAEVRGAR